jgi:hypothetical protein
MRFEYSKYPEIVTKIYFPKEYQHNNIILYTEDKQYLIKILPQTWQRWKFQFSLNNRIDFRSEIGLNDLLDFDIKNFINRECILIDEKFLNIIHNWFKTLQS